MFDSFSQLTSFGWVHDIIFCAYVVTIISIVVIVVSENRNPVKSLAWITVLMLLPVLGIILYLFFGRNIKNSHKLSRRNRRRLKKNEPAVNVDYKSLNLTSESIQEIRLGNSLAGAYLYTGNDVTVFTGGEEKFSRLKEDLRSAKKFINIQYYIFCSDRIGSEIADILIDKALSGVTVRVIYDHVGSFSVRTRFFNRMRKAGVQVYPFFKVTFAWLGSRVNWRNHRKLCVIDGRVGYLGGMNIADRYIDGGKDFALWRDTHVRVEGPIVMALQQSFSYDWHFMGHSLINDDVSVQETPRGSIGAQLVTSGPTSQWPNIAYMFHKAISNAKRRVYIQTPYFLPTDTLFKDLQTAALSHVDVRIMIPRCSDSRLLNYASASYISGCLRAGIKIYFYEPGMLHSKMIIIDDDISTIGSTNFDFRSFEHNFEGNLFFYSQELTQHLLEVYRNDQAQCSRVIPEQWKHRPLMRRATESIVRLLSPIL